MGSLFLTWEHDSAICSTATCPAPANGVDDVDALDSSDTLDANANDMLVNRLLPWLLFQAGATAPVLSLSPESLTPQTSPRFDLISDLSDLSLLRFPFFNPSETFDTNNTTTSEVHQQRIRSKATTFDNALDSAPATFFLSPSASTSSLVSGSTWSDASRDSRETRTIMAAGQTLEFLADVPMASSTDDYFTRPSACTAADMTSNTTDQWRPDSPQSGTSQQSASPMFSRWAKRHHHHHHHHHHRHQHSGLLQPQSTSSGRGSTESKASGSSSPIVKRSPARSRSSSIQKRQSQAAMPQMTREEFEALPLAIQRKYFSTLERLRFARESGHVEGISQHYDDISHFKRRKPRQDRSVSEHITSRIRRRSQLDSRLQSPDSSPSHTALSPKIQKREYTREEQVVLARRLRASVILDAADEAIYKLNTRAAKQPVADPETFSPSVLSRRNSMDSYGGLASPVEQTSNREVPQSFYDTFRWLDEEEDLDLRLFLDDYHANLRDNIPSPTKQQRPSFRRHLSISKIPFGRNSVSLSRPGTKDATTPTSPLHSPTGSASNQLGHTRRRSRALSLITPRHSPHDSITTFDPAAAHYQDPEARLKLRVYLASPQKFDEAIEFGFPSTDVVSGVPVLNRNGAALNQRQARQKPSDTSSNMRTFLADDDDDDNISLNSDQPSLADPESPKTPQAVENKPVAAIRPLRVVSTDQGPSRDGSKPPSEGGGGGYAQVPVSSREMTLRMTLTRPDLRAHEEQIYGWQQKQGQQPQAGRKSTTMTPLAMESVTYIGDVAHKDSMEKMTGFDWSSTTADKGVMKRFWNRVRRS